MKPLLCTLVVLLLTALAKPATATWRGKGEIVGKVTSSKVVGMTGGQVFFNLFIESQEMEDGAGLGQADDDGVTFFYSGPEMEAISAGDRLRLRVNSGNNYGIRAESVEFIDDQPGGPMRSEAVEWAATALVCGLAAFIYVVTRARVSWKNHKSELLP